MSEIEAKLRKFYLPEISNVCKLCNWELHACNEPYLQDYSDETAAGLVIWSKPGTCKLRLYVVSFKLHHDLLTFNARVVGTLESVQHDALSLQERHVEQRS